MPFKNVDLKISEEAPELSIFEIAEVLVIGVRFSFKTDAAISQICIFASEISDIIFGKVPDVKRND